MIIMNYYNFNTNRFGLYYTIIYSILVIVLFIIYLLLVLTPGYTTIAYYEYNIIQTTLCT